MEPPKPHLLGTLAEVDPRAAGWFTCYAMLRSWQERLTQIGEVLTAQVVGGWEKIDEQLRVRQQSQIEFWS